MLDPAVPPDQPLSRHIALKAFSGLLVGFVLALLAAVIRVTLVGARPNPPIIRGA